MTGSPKLTLLGKLKFKFATISAFLLKCETRCLVLPAPATVQALSDSLLPANLLSHQVRPSLCFIFDICWHCACLYCSHIVLTYLLTYSRAKEVKSLQAQTAAASRAWQASPLYSDHHSHKRPLREWHRVLFHIFCSHDMLNTMRHVNFVNSQLRTSKCVLL